MQSSSIQSRLSPFSMMVSSSALSASYRALSLGPAGVRGCSMFGSMEVAVETGLKSEIAVDGDALLQVLRSLPSGELELAATENSLQWKCGSAKGRLALLGDGVAVVAPEIPEGIEFEEVKAAFGRGLELGSLACGTSALMSVGLFGVSIAPSADGSIRAYSTDNNTIASALMLSAPGPLAGRSATLSPASAKLLASLSSREGAAVGFDEQSVYCRTPDTTLLLKQIPPLKFDISGVISEYLSEEVTVPLQRDVVSAFIRRAEALTEEKKTTEVAVSVVEGAVKLSFADGKSSSEEYYLAEGGGEISVDPILIGSRLLARALGQASRVVFDQAEDRNALVLRGDQEFTFVVSGQAPTAA